MPRFLQWSFSASRIEHFRKSSQNNFIFHHTSRSLEDTIATLSPPCDEWRYTRPPSTITNSHTLQTYSKEKREQWCHRRKGDSVFPRKSNKIQNPPTTAQKFPRSLAFSSDRDAYDRPSSYTRFAHVLCVEQYELHAKIPLEFPHVECQYLQRSFLPVWRCAETHGTAPKHHAGDRIFSFLTAIVITYSRKGWFPAAPKYKC